MRILRRLDIPNSQYATFVNELVAGAVVGLKGPNYNLQSGRDQLGSVQKDMLGRARKNSDAYLGRTFLIGGGIAAIRLFLAAVMYFVVPHYLKKPDIAAAYKTALAWIVPFACYFRAMCSASSLSAWVANRTLTFDKTTTFDPYYFPPWLRFLYIAIVSGVLLVALWFEFVMLGIDGYLLNDVKTDLSAGLVIGLLGGVSEALIVELLLARLKPVERSVAPAKTEPVVHGRFRLGGRPIRAPDQGIVASVVSAIRVTTTGHAHSRRRSRRKRQKQTDRNVKSARLSCSRRMASSLAGAESVLSRVKAFTSGSGDDGVAQEWPGLARWCRMRKSAGWGTRVGELRSSGLRCRGVEKPRSRSGVHRNQIEDQESGTR